MFGRPMIFAGLAAASLAVPIAPALAHTDLTLVNFGGTAARAQILALLRPWEEKTGKRAEMLEYNGGIDDIRSQVEAANVTWDVVDMEYSDLILACEQGLLEKLDASMLPDSPDGASASTDFREGALHDCGIGNIVWATVYAFDGERMSGDAPDSLGDFFDTDAFPGKRGVRRDPRGLLEWALMADGVATDDVYAVLDTPDGVDRAFRVLEPMRQDILWWDSGSEPARLLADEAVAMTMAWNGRLHRPLTVDEQSIEIVWDGQIWEYDLFAIPKGSRRKREAMDFIEFATSTEKLADWTEYIPYGPARKSSAALVDPETASRLPTDPANTANALRYDSSWWADNIEAIMPRFTAFAAPRSIVEGAKAGRF